VCEPPGPQAYPPAAAGRLRAARRQYASGTLPEVEIWEALRAGAAQHFGRPAEIDALEPLLGGASRELWGFVAVVDGRRHRLVLRRDPEGMEDPAARRRELQALTAAHRHGVPVPEPFWLHEDGAGLVMARVDGETIPRRLLREDRYADARAGLTRQLGAAAAALHAVPLAEVAAVDQLAEAPGPAAIAGLESELDRIGEPHPALELGLRWLRDHLPEPRQPGLVHGDLRLGNLVMDERGLVAVLDWELVHAGDPLEDLGWLCIRSWRFGNDDRPVAGVGARQALLDSYAAAGGRRASAEELRFWEVAGNVRWGVICMLQAQLHGSGGQRALERAAIGRRTCEPEWDLLAMIG
jgi:aminoglycoside phosphotransferase (APT) family kinase protein